jgi:predicted ATPase
MCILRTLQHFTMQHTRHATIYYSMGGSPSKSTHCKQLNWNHEDFISIVNECVPHLNSQQSIATQVLSSVNEHSGATFFLDGPIGIGKTYVDNKIVIKLQKKKKKKYFNRYAC